MPAGNRSPSGRGRIIAFAAIVAVCVLGGGTFVAIAALGGDGTTSEARVARAVAEAPPSIKGERVLVRAADPADPGLDGSVAIARLGTDAGPRPTGLACSRVYMAGGRGICLKLAGTGVDYTVVVFDRSFRQVASLGLNGLPSRARVSPDGRLGTVTSFVTGHSYASSGEFSTNTRLLDLRRGRYIADLEDFTVMNDGERLEAPDFNFWGVTFERDGDGFYATLSTGSHRYLVHGSVRARRVQVLRDRVECPSLSPDGTRIAYKRTLGGGRWRAHVLDLRSGADRPLAESRSIDDQLEWAGNRFVLYGDGEDVYLVAADGSGAPRRMLGRAASPAVLN
jgi:hypothetical protein